MTPGSLPTVVPGSRWFRLGLAAAISAAYVLIFPWLYRWAGGSVAALALVPVGAWALLGFRAGAVAGLLSWPVQGTLKVLVEGMDWAHFTGAGYLVLVLAGPVAGRFSDLYRQVRQQARILAREQEALRQQMEERRLVEERLRASERRMQLFIEQIPAVLWTTDHELHMTSFTGLTRAGANTPAFPAVGGALPEFLPPGHPAISAHRRALSGQPASYELARKGRVFQAHVEPFHNAGGQLIGTIGIALDISDRKNAEASLRISEERFRTAFDGAAVGMALLDVTGKVLQANRSLCNMLGRPEPELLVTNYRDLIHTDDLHTGRAAVDCVMSGMTDGFQVEHRLFHRHGHVVWVQSSLSAVRDDHGQPLHLIVQIQDITDRKGFEARLIHLADHDPLTDLFNRRRFQAELEHHLVSAKEGGTSGALLFLDLDQFKDVNDSQGHRAGDEVLIGVARLLRQELRGSDVLARLGGDEFALLLPRADAAEAEAVAKRILAAMGHRAISVSGHEARITASIGIVLFPEHTPTAEELLARADQAMYQAKQNGRNRAVLWRPNQDWQAHIVTRRTWENRIRAALSGNGLILHGQPILDLHTQQIARYELLLRMRDAGNRLILPGAFLGVAERCGLMREIDKWVVRQAVRLVREQQEAGRSLTLHANLSATALADDELLSLIRDQLAQTGINPASLVLEITETAIMANLNRAQTFIATLRSAGCCFALDDFGVGYSSLSQLKHLDVSYLKIDGSFIRNLCNDPLDQHLVRTVVQVARGLGKKSIAEYVGDAATLQLVQEYGVDLAQGYQVGHPDQLPETPGDQPVGRHPYSTTPARRRASTTRSARGRVDGTWT